MKHFKYLILACLVTAIMITPSVVNSTMSNSAILSTLVAQNSTANEMEENKIREALLADAQAQNWQPQIGEITIVNDYAIATTYDEVTGGESVLRKQQGVWKVIGGTGGAFSRPKDLIDIANVPLPIARQLLKLRAKQQN